MKIKYAMLLVIASMASGQARNLTAHANADYEAEHAEANSDLGTFVGLVALSIAFMVGFKLEQWGIEWLPESAAAVTVGVVACQFVWITGDRDLMSMMRFDMHFFMDWLIPPIIFEAAANMNVRAFLTNLRPTLLFAFAGTTFSAFVVAGVVFAAGQLGLCYALSPLAALTFGSLISATDPVAVLTTFQSLGVNPNLFSMVFGESVLNDAVAIVLCKTLISFTLVQASLPAVLGALIAFVQIFTGSSAIGLGFGALSALTFKHLRLREHEDTVFLEVMLSFTFPWAAFFLAEALEFSGIVAILFSGMVFATYTRVNVSEAGLHLMAGTYKVVANIAERFVFVYLGFACVRMAKVGLFAGTVWRLSACGLLGCFLGRLHIFLGASLVNRHRRKQLRSRGMGGAAPPHPDPPPIPPRYMLIMWLSGLRGGVAFAIAGSSWRDADFPQHCGGRKFAGGPNTRAEIDCTSELVASDSTAILQMTMLIAVFTTFVLGGAMPFLARACDVIGNGPEDDAASDDSTSSFANISPSSSFVDNRAAPLLHAGSSGRLGKTGEALSREGSAGSPAALATSPTPLVEESHGLLVRLLTHEIEYTCACRCLEAPFAVARIRPPRLAAATLTLTRA